MLAHPIATTNTEKQQVQPSRTTDKDFSPLAIEEPSDQPKFLREVVVFIATRKIQQNLHHDRQDFVNTVANRQEAHQPVPTVLTLRWDTPQEFFWQAPTMPNAPQCLQTNVQSEDNPKGTAWKQGGTQ